jgi:Zn-dependent M28 family amino/carboxypeptidase
LQTFPLDLPEQQGSIAAAGKASQVVSQNVLATLPGRGTLASEWVILGAHYDHVGFEASGDSILVFNGADDNASGTALVLEVARILSEFVAADAGADRRSIMFHAYGAEEVGLVGSSYFTSSPTVPVETIVAMMNVDMVGRLREELIVRGAYTGAWWQSMLTDINEGRLQLTLPAETPTRSDHFPFLLQGIPVLQFFTGTHAEYHTPLDDVWLLNLDGMEEIGGLVVELLWELAVRTDLAVGP